jgi:hypothetical protein
MKPVTHAILNFFGVLTIFCVGVLVAAYCRAENAPQRPVEAEPIYVSPPTENEPEKAPEAEEEGPELSDNDRRLNVLRDSGEWNDSAKLVLAQCLYGEAGILPHYSRIEKGVVPCNDKTQCFDNRDWKLIPWVLLKRWETINVHTSKSFEEVVRAYSVPVNRKLASREREASQKALGNFNEVARIKRRRFIQAIDWEGSILHGRGSRLGMNPEFFFDSWIRLTQTVEDWGNGRIENECPEARHWNNPGGGNRSGFPRIDCGKTLNRFYGIR